MKRYPQLDLVRALAIILVLFRHVHLEYGTQLNHFEYLFFSYLLEIGWIGVDLFFVLSGFLVSGLVFLEWEKTEKFSFGLFYLKRTFRIVPSFYFFILMTFLVNYFGILEVGHESLKTYASEILFLQSYKGGVYMHTWSLAVEEHFYIILPLLLFCLLKYQKKHILEFLMLFVLFIVLLRNFDLFRLGLYQGFEFNSHHRIDSLMIGVILRYLFEYKRAYLLDKISKWNYLFWIVPALCILHSAFSGQHSFYNEVLGSTIMAISFAVLIFLIMNQTFQFHESLFVKLVLEIGKCSYCIYLWHEVANVSAKNLFLKYYKMDFHVYLLAYLFVSIAFGALLTYTFEHYFLKIRNSVLSKL